MADEGKNGEDGLAEGPEDDRPMSFFEHLIQRLEIMAYLGVIYLGGYLLGVFLFLSEI